MTAVFKFSYGVSLLQAEVMSSEMEERTSKGRRAVATENFLRLEVMRLTRKLTSRMVNQREGSCGVKVGAWKLEMVGLESEFRVGSCDSAMLRERKTGTGKAGTVVLWWV